MSRCRHLVSVVVGASLALMAGCWADHDLRRADAAFERGDWSDAWARYERRSDRSRELGTMPIAAQRRAEQAMGKLLDAALQQGIERQAQGDAAFALERSDSVLELARRSAPSWSTSRARQLRTAARAELMQRAIQGLSGRVDAGELHVAADVAFSYAMAREWGLADAETTLASMLGRARDAVVRVAAERASQAHVAGRVEEALLRWHHAAAYAQREGRRAAADAVLAQSMPVARDIATRRAAEAGNGISVPLVRTLTLLQQLLPATSSERVAVDAALAGQRRQVLERLRASDASKPLSRLVWARLAVLVGEPAPPDLQTLQAHADAWREGRVEVRVADVGPSCPDLAPQLRREPEAPGAAIAIATVRLGSCRLRNQNRQQRQSVCRSIPYQDYKKRCQIRTYCTGTFSSGPMAGQCISTAKSESCTNEAYTAYRNECHDEFVTLPQTAWSYRGEATVIGPGLQHTVRLDQRETTASVMLDKAAAQAARDIHEAIRAGHQIYVDAVVANLRQQIASAGADALELQLRWVAIHGVPLPSLDLAALGIRDLPRERLLTLMLGTNAVYEASGAGASSAAAPLVEPQPSAAAVAVLRGSPLGVLRLHHAGPEIDDPSTTVPLRLEARAAATSGRRGDRAAGRDDLVLASLRYGEAPLQGHESNFLELGMRLEGKTAGFLALQSSALVGAVDGVALGVDRAFGSPGRRATMSARLGASLHYQAIERWGSWSGLLVDASGQWQPGRWVSLRAHLGLNLLQIVRGSDGDGGLHDHYTPLGLSAALHLHPRVTLRLGMTKFIGSEINLRPSLQLEVVP